MRRSTPDPLGHDDDVLTQSEALDEDDMGVDPLEGGMDPAEGWAASNRYGTTAIEQGTGADLSRRRERLAGYRQSERTLMMTDHLLHLDVAVGSRTRTGLDVIAVICALMDLVDSDHVDLLDLDRAGPVARQHALVPGDPLYEYRPGEFARQQM